MALSAHELAQMLLAGPDLPVHFQYNYGDYWRTQVAPGVDEVNEGEVKYSDYHQLDKVVEYDSERDERDVSEQDTRNVILLG
jgi:hypothetical protein